MILIVGAGVAGSYLAALLRQDGKEDYLVYDRNPSWRGHLCAWGCFYSLLRDKLKPLGLNVDDYILCRADTLVLNGVRIKLRNEASLDKPKLLNDLCPESHVIKKEFSFSDEALASLHPNHLVVNATGIPFGKHYRIHTKEYKLRIHGLEPNTAYVNIDLNYVGYGWMFPLDEDGRDWHLGAGCVNADPEVLIRNIARRYRARPIPNHGCYCERDIRIINPGDCMLGENFAISIGEAAGAVYPISGEGIVPSMESAEVFYKWYKEHKPVTEYGKALWDKFLGENLGSFDVWRYMEKYPRLAWLLGAPSMVKRARKRIMPVMTPTTYLKLVSQLLLPWPSPAPSSLSQPAPSEPPQLGSG